MRVESRGFGKFSSICVLLKITSKGGGGGVGYDKILNSLHNCTGMVHSLSSGKGKMFLCAALHAFTPHVNAWKNSIGIVVQIQARR